jgi:hypothetical protein
MKMNEQAIKLAFYVVVPGATVRVTAVPRIAAGMHAHTVAATAAFGSVSAWTAYNEGATVGLGLGLAVFRHNCKPLGWDAFSEHEGASFPVNLGELIRLFENAVQ